MHTYYQILGVPVGASTEEIRAQFKKLVRIYHPDRFTRADEKEYMAQKLSEINEAYKMLMAQATGQTPNGSATDWEAWPANQLMLQPAALDFGNLSVNSRQELSFLVDNPGGSAQRFGLSVSPGDDWFYIVTGRQVDAQKTFPVQFTVLANTHKLAPGRRYQGWIEVKMDTMTKRLPISLQVDKQAGVRPQWLQLPGEVPLLQWTTVFMLLLTLLLLLGWEVPNSEWLVSALRTIFGGNAP